MHRYLCSWKETDPPAATITPVLIAVFVELEIDAMVCPSVDAGGYHPAASNEVATIN
jgi:hypothetical protein